MARKGENIYKRKDGRWEGRYTKAYSDLQKPVHGYVYGKTYAEAKQKLTEAKANVIYGRLPANTKVICYNDVLSAWLFSEKLKTKESTFARYSHLVDCHIRKPLGTNMLNMIETETVESYILSLLSEGRSDNTGGLASKTVSDILFIIKSSMEYAADKGYTVVCNTKKLSVKVSKHDIRVFSKIEQNSLTSYLLNDLDVSKLGVLLCLYTGIRIGELCALRWEDIDIENKVLSVNKTLIRIQNTNTLIASKTKIIISAPKSNCSIRKIPLPDCIIPLLKAFAQKGDTFFLTGETERFVEPRTMQNRFKKYVSACNIADANFHALRHTFATRCVELGFEIKSLSEILGHANVNITLNRYVHSSFELKTLNMNRLSLPA